MFSNLVNNYFLLACSLFTRAENKAVYTYYILVINSITQQENPLLWFLVLEMLQLLWSPNTQWARLQSFNIMRVKHHAHTHTSEHTYNQPHTMCLILMICAALTHSLTPNHRLSSKPCYAVSPRKIYRRDKTSTLPSAKWDGYTLNENAA